METESILNDLLAQFAQPSVYERTVSPDELRKAATVMAKRGYLPTKQSLAALEKYLQGYALWFTGDVGTGKTFFFRTLPIQRFRGHEDRRIVILNFGTLAGMTIGELKDFLAQHDDDEIVFDDVGKEPIFNEFGSRFEVLPWLVEKRMEVVPRTHFTSNYPKKYFDERYGYGLFDRLYSLAHVVEFKGRSRRVLEPRIIFASKTSGNTTTSARTCADDKSIAKDVKTPSRAVSAPLNADGHGVQQSENAKNAQKRPFTPSVDAVGAVTPPAKPEAVTGYFKPNTVMPADADGVPLP